MNNFSIKGKNILLLFLIVYSIYQTAELWLRDSPSRNFFYTLFSQYNTSLNAELQNFASPYRIITSIGGNRFEILYSNISDTHIRQLLDNAITLALMEGEFVTTHDTIDYNTFLGYRSFIYEYNFSMPTETFVSIFPEQSNILTEQFEYFNSIVIAPSPSTSNLLYFIFIDTYNDKAYEYRLVRSGLHDTINREIQNTHRILSSNQIYYVSSKLMGLNFNQNIFLPTWREQGYIYNSVNIYNNHYEGKPLLPLVGRNLYMFFDNPASVWQDNRNGILTYSDENIVVQYFPDNTLEYINYRQGTTQGDLVSDFDTAIRFINRDTMVINEFYLSNYIEENNRRIFYFDYVINNLPIVLTKDFLHDISITDLEHAIEVTVENGIVTRYRKIAYSFELNQHETSMINTDLINIVNNIGNEEVLNIYFGYNKLRNIEENNIGSVSIEWIIENKKVQNS